MPELPEVETIRKQLSQYIIGKAVKTIEVIDPSLGQYLTKEKVSGLTGPPAGEAGLRVVKVERRAKVLLIKLEKDYYLAIHLKMTGKVIYRDSKTSSKSLQITEPDLQLFPNKFTRAVIVFNDDSKIFFQDERKFGWIKILSEKQLETDLLKNPFGPEPLTPQFTKTYFFQMLSTSKQPIKVVLLDQAKIGGIGNIYANESLYVAKIHPSRRGNTISREEADQLFDAINIVLQKGLDYRGASEDNYRDALGQKGEYHLHFMVYQQHGKPCKNCGTKIVRIAIGGRGTFYCPVCQLI